MKILEREVTLAERIAREAWECCKPEVMITVYIGVYAVTRIPSPTRDELRFHICFSSAPELSCTVHLTQYTYDCVDCCEHVRDFVAYSDEMELQDIERE